LVCLLLGTANVLQLNVVGVEVLNYTDVVILLAIRWNDWNSRRHLRSVVTSGVGFLVHNICKGLVLGWIGVISGVTSASVINAVI
jgi:hypothetical protein